MILGKLGSFLWNLPSFPNALTVPILPGLAITPKQGHRKSLRLSTCRFTKLWRIMEFSWKQLFSSVAWWHQGRRRKSRPARRRWGTVDSRVAMKKNLPVDHLAIPANGFSRRLEFKRLSIASWKIRIILPGERWENFPRKALHQSLHWLLLESWTLSVS